MRWLPSLLLAVVAAERSGVEHADDEQLRTFRRIQMESESGGQDSQEIDNFQTTDLDSVERGLNYHEYAGDQPDHRHRPTTIWKVKRVTIMKTGGSLMTTKGDFAYGAGMGMGMGTTMRMEGFSPASMGDDTSTSRGGWMKGVSTQVNEITQMTMQKSNKV